MMRLIMIISVNCLMTISVMSQFTYFNQLDGPVDYPETTGNIEVVGDSLYVHGAVSNGGDLCEYIRIYDNEGVFIDERLYCFDFFVYSGATSSFQPIPDTDEFLFMHAKVDTVIRGFIMKFDLGLDTIWTKQYDEYFPETYFYTFAPSDSGFVIAGEHGPTPGERGTFIMEIDTVGNLLWHNEIHAPEEGLFRSHSISTYGNNYITSGVDQAGDNESYLEVLDTSGNLSYSLQDNSPPPLGQRGRMLHLINSENEVIACQAVSYSWLTPPSLAYNAIRIYKLDTITPELLTQNEYFEDQDWLGGHVRKIIEVNDGYTMMGGYREPFGGVNQRKAWIMKVDNEFQQDWYTELSYDDAPGNAHYPYDMEQTSDGGYVVVGAYRNSADFYDRTWLVKVDACGDLVWQGCEPVGTGEYQFVDTKLKVYPNPAQEMISIELEEDFDPSSVQLTNMLGEIVFKTEFEEVIDLSKLESGLYVLQIKNQEGEVLTKKLIVE